jgi:hypothetical protein
MGCRNNSCRCNTVPIRFNGEDIDCLGVLKGDTFEAVVRKVSDFVCNISFQDGVDGQDGADGLDGQGIDHVSFSESSLGDEPGLPGATDTYVVWGDVAETVNLGTFTVYNGTNAPAEGDTVFHRVVDIGPLNLQASAGTGELINLPIAASNIVGVNVVVYTDGGTLYSFDVIDGDSNISAGGWRIAGTTIELFHPVGSFFDSVNFSSTSINRGRILIHYIP